MNAKNAKNAKNVKEKEIEELCVNQLNEQLIVIDTDDEDILSSAFLEIRYYTKRIEELYAKSILEIEQQRFLLC